MIDIHLGQIKVVLDGDRVSKKTLNEIRKKFEDSRDDAICALLAHVAKFRVAKGDRINLSMTVHLKGVI